MIVLVCGSRDWTDRETIRAWLAKLSPGATIVHGAARGADSIAGEIATEQGRKVHAFPADWERYGNSAGPRRNQQMIEVMRPKRVLAFTDALMRGTGGASRPTGTTDCVMRALAAGIPCTLIPSRKITPA